MHRSIRTAGASIVALVVAVVVTLAGVVSLSPAVGAEPTGGCRPVGGGAVTTEGPHRATVVVDTGSGPVWSACITFAGTITGIEALELATATIPGLAPVYEPYAGQGRAVCRLIGVGNDPPDCLGKSVEYWSYFRNGAYARGGGSASVVSDGDVEGWSFSRGTAPRSATTGTEAVPASAIPTTAPPTSAPPPATDPAPLVPDPDGPAPSTPSGPDQGAAPSAPDTGPTAGAPGAPGGDDATGSRPDAPSDIEGDPSALRPAVGDGDGDGDGVGQVGSGSAALVEPGDSGGSGSSMTSVLGFGAALGSVGVAALLVRRRRLALHTAPVGARLGPDAPP